MGVVAVASLAGGRAGLSFLCLALLACCWRIRAWIQLRIFVMLQPQFSTYSLLANVLASPLVAPVTLRGTAAVPLVVLVPSAGTVLIALSGTFSAGVAATARFTAQLSHDRRRYRDC
ncbi:hypothetical protein FBY31_0729 [Arthrobacter sp. SLBN-100]|uniref:hypothetical protein n=1 Tax=Arthrobacter sp. SLBN-100 TaxID=2768450 RepID=UPI00115283A7|nr:hypothetical protein [Arthrobacter sp. SLBN-100]TQJ66690.1 hypothetical protein FBY31_0729 [Arthrobacter sp. SLBN-100]